jgi:F-type H+-transporting ATPase subunit alpha
LDLAQFRDLASFSQFSTDLDAETRQRIERGQRLTELLKQPQYSPKAIWEMYVLLLAATHGYFDKVPLEKIQSAEAALLQELKSKHAKLTEVINTGDKVPENVQESVLKVARTITGEYEVNEEKPAVDLAESDTGS